MRKLLKFETFIFHFLNESVWYETRLHHCTETGSELPPDPNEGRAKDTKGTRQQQAKVNQVRSPASKQPSTQKATNVHSNRDPKSSNPYTNKDSSKPAEKRKTETTKDAYDGPSLAELFDRDTKENEEVNKVNKDNFTTLDTASEYGKTTIVSRNAVNRVKQSSNQEKRRQPHRSNPNKNNRQNDQGPIQQRVQNGGRFRNIQRSNLRNSVKSGGQQGGGNTRSPRQQERMQHAPVGGLHGPSRGYRSQQVQRSYYHQGQQGHRSRGSGNFLGDVIKEHVQLLYWRQYMMYMQRFMFPPKVELERQGNGYYYYSI